MTNPVHHRVAQRLWLLADAELRWQVRRADVWELDAPLGDRLYWLPRVFDRLQDPLRDQLIRERLMEPEW